MPKQLRACLERSESPPVSCPAKAGHPVTTGSWTVLNRNQVVTGSPASAGDDTLWSTYPWTGFWHPLLRNPLGRSVIQADPRWTKQTPTVWPTDQGCDSVFASDSLG